MISRFAIQYSLSLEDDPKNTLHELALEPQDELPQRRPKHLLFSIGRLVQRKVSLFVEGLADGRTAVELRTLRY